MPSLEDISKKIPCNFSGPSVYRNQWYLFDNHCYLVRDEAKYSWDTARYFCQDNGGHVASIHSFEETDFILRLISNAPNTDFWIGLSARGLDSSLTWSDDSPFEFLYWEDNFNDTIGINKCVIFDKQRGSWRTEHCNRFLGVVCKRGVNASYDFTTPEPTPLMPGNCVKGWYRLGNKCYKPFGGRWSRRESWNDAKKECEMKDATLASIHSADEQNFLADIMLDLGTSMWIGLENIDKGTMFKWSDDSLLDFTEWNVNEPMITAEDRDYASGSSRLCVQFDYETTAMGKWSDIPCYRQNGYVCQKFINPLLTEPSEDPFTCQKIDITGWSRLGSTCYGVFEDSQLSWVEAQAKCRTLDANLITFSSSAVAIFLKKRLKKRDKYFWIGTREAREFVYESVRKHKQTYSNWLEGQPQQRSEIDNCVSMDSQAKWIVRDCKEKLPFVCAWSSEEEVLEKEVDESTSPCPDKTWRRLGSFCYYFSLRETSWNKAMLSCFKSGGSLASFHSLEEVTLVTNYILHSGSTERTFFSIGLGQLADGSYAWVDHSPLDFTYFENDQPTVYQINNRGCVKISLATGKWSAVDCESQHFPYICKLSKKTDFKKSESLNSTEIPNEVEATKSKRTDDVVTSSISTGGIVGIMISVLLVLIVIGAVIYHLYPSRTMRPTLLEHDNL